MSTPAVRPAKAAQRRGPAWPVVVAAAVVAALAGVVFVVVRRDHTPRTPAPRAEEPARELPYPALVALAEQVRSLQQQKRFGESLPGTRELLRQHQLRGRLVPDMMIEYGQVLNNAAFESGDHAPRSSFERIALERQSLAIFHTALTMAKTPRERSKAINVVGFVQEAWGFPYDAYLAYGAAVQADSTFAEARRNLEHFAVTNLNAETAPPKAR